MFNIFYCVTSRKDTEFLNFNFNISLPEVTFDSGMVRKSVQISPSSSTKRLKIGHGISCDMAEILMKYLVHSSNEGFIGAADYHDLLFVHLRKKK